MCNTRTFSILLSVAAMACTGQDTEPLGNDDALLNAPLSSGKADGTGDDIVIADGDRVFIRGEAGTELRWALFISGAPVRTTSTGLEVISRGPVACAVVSDSPVCTFVISNPESGFVDWFLIGDEPRQAEWGYEFGFGGDENPEAQVVFDALRSIIPATAITSNGDFEVIKTQYWECQSAPEGTGSCGFSATPCRALAQSFCKVLPPPIF